MYSAYGIELQHILSLVTISKSSIIRGEGRLLPLHQAGLYARFIVWDLITRK